MLLETRLTSTTRPAQRSEKVSCQYSTPQILQEAKEGPQGFVRRPQQAAMCATSQRRSGCAADSLLEFSPLLAVQFR